MSFSEQLSNITSDAVNAKVKKSTTGRILANKIKWTVPIINACYKAGLDPFIENQGQTPVNGAIAAAKDLTQFWMGVLKQTMNHDGVPLWLESQVGFQAAEMVSAYIETYYQIPDGKELDNMRQTANYSGFAPELPGSEWDVPDGKYKLPVAQAMQVSIGLLATKISAILDRGRGPYLIGGEDPFEPVSEVAYKFTKWVSDTAYNEYLGLGHTVEDLGGNGVLTLKSYINQAGRILQCQLETEIDAVTSYLLSKENSPEQGGLQLVSEILRFRLDNPYGVNVDKIIEQSKKAWHQANEMAARLNDEALSTTEKEVTSLTSRRQDENLEIEKNENVELSTLKPPSIMF